MDESLGPIVRHAAALPDEPSLLILVNGSDENVRFHLPNDIEWEMIWSSAEIAGEYPGQGTQIEKLAEFDEEAEDKPAGRFRNHLQRLNTMYWQMDENADSLTPLTTGCPRTIRPCGRCRL